MDTFRQGVGLQAYGQQDPLVTYKREAFDMFEQLTQTIRHEVVQAMLRMRMTVTQPSPPPAGAPAADGPRPATALPRGLQPPAAGAGNTADLLRVRRVQESSAAGSRTATATAAVPKVGRNEPCPCDSGKKYKRCHGAAV